MIRLSVRLRRCERINRRIAHLTTERVRGDQKKISVGECLRTYTKLETEIERFIACLPPQTRSAFSARLKRVPQQTLVVAAADNMLRNATNTVSPSISTYVEGLPPPHKADK
jgi:hypothetical protein